MDRTTWVLTVVFLLVVTLVGVWCMDVGFSAMMIEGKIGMSVKAINGFWSRSPVQQFHLGLGLTIISTLAIVFIAIWSIMEGPDTSKKRKRLLS